MQRPRKNLMIHRTANEFVAPVTRAVILQRKQTPARRYLRLILSARRPMNIPPVPYAIPNAGPATRA